MLRATVRARTRWLLLRLLLLLLSLSLSLLLGCDAQPVKRLAITKPAEEPYTFSTTSDTNVAIEVELSNTGTSSTSVTGITYEAISPATHAQWLSGNLNSFPYTVQDASVFTGLTLTAAPIDLVAGVYTRMMRITSTADQPAGDRTRNFTMTVLPRLGFTYVNATVIDANTTSAVEGVTFEISIAPKTKLDANLVVTAVISNNDTVVTLETSSITFTPANWQTRQSLRLSTADNFRQDGDLNFTLSYELTSTASAWNNSDKMIAPDHKFVVKDNDNFQLEFSKSTMFFELTEGAGAETFTVRVTAQPPETFTITFPASTQVAFVPPSVTIGATNWTQTYSVNISAVDDDIIEGHHSVLLDVDRATFLSSNASLFSLVTLVNITANITDNDIQPSAVTPAIGQPAGGTAVVVRFPSPRTFAGSVTLPTVQCLFEDIIAVRFSRVVTGTVTGERSFTCAAPQCVGITNAIECVTPVFLQVYVNGQLSTRQTEAGQYEYYSTPTITRVSPTHADVRDTVLLTVFGTGFDQGVESLLACRVGNINAASVSLGTVDGEKVLLCKLPKRLDLIGNSATVSVQVSLNGQEFQSSPSSVAIKYEDTEDANNNKFWAGFIIAVNVFGLLLVVFCVVECRAICKRQNEKLYQVFDRSRMQGPTKLLERIRDRQDELHSLLEVEERERKRRKNNNNNDDEEYSGMESGFGSIRFGRRRARHRNGDAETLPAQSPRRRLSKMFDPLVRRMSRSVSSRPTDGKDHAESPSSRRSAGSVEMFTFDSKQPQKQRLDAQPHQQGSFMVMGQPEDFDSPRRVASDQLSDVESLTERKVPERKHDPSDTGAGLAPSSARRTHSGRRVKLHVSPISPKPSAAIVDVQPASNVGASAAGRQIVMQQQQRQQQQQPIVGRTLSGVSPRARRLKTTTRADAVEMHRMKSSHGKSKSRHKSKADDGSSHGGHHHRKKKRKNRRKKKE